jgi:hypothetical protein
MKTDLTTAKNSDCYSVNSTANLKAKNSASLRGCCSAKNSGWSLAKN